MLTAIAMPKVMMWMSMKGPEVAMLFFDLLNAAAIATVSESGERREEVVRVITVGASGSNSRAWLRVCSPHRPRASSGPGSGEIANLSVSCETDPEVL